MRINEKSHVFQMGMLNQNKSQTETTEENFMTK